MTDQQNNLEELIFYDGLGCANIFLLKDEKLYIPANLQACINPFDKKANYTFYSDDPTIIEYVKTYSNEKRVKPNGNR